MKNKKTILVTGGTGNQGGAIVRNLIGQDKWKVAVLTRDTKSKKSQNLKKQGVEVLQGDLNDPLNYKEHLKDVYGVFSMQTFTDGIEKEIQQGKQLADIAKENDVKHFIYSSVAGADLKSGIPHFESKYEIEKHIKKIGIFYTIIRPVSFYENLLIPDVKKRILKGKLVMPLHKEIEQEYISVNDIGIVGAQLFKYPLLYTGKTIPIASDKMTMNELTQTISDVLKKEIKYQKLPSLITRLVMGKNLYKMFSWINKNKPEFVDNIESIRQEFKGLTTLKTWLEKEFK